MPAPATKTLKDLNGKWKLNKDLSDSPDPVLALQSINWVLRKGIAAGSVTLIVKQYEAPPSPVNGQATLTPDPVVHIDFQQTASGLKGNEEKRSLDWHARDWQDWVWGRTKGQTKWISADELKGEIVKEHGEWIGEGWDEESEYIWDRVESVEKEWISFQVWGFQKVGGERRFARKILVKKGEKSEKLLSVYDLVE